MGDVYGGKNEAIWIFKLYAQAFGVPVYGGRSRRRAVISHTVGASRDRTLGVSDLRVFYCGGMPLYAQ